MKYTELKDKQQAEINAFPLGAAFSNKQFIEMMTKWGLTENDTDKIYSIGSGCYIRKADSATFHEIIDRQEKERKQAINDDETGDGYVYEMFNYELSNHEFCITYSLESTLDSLGLSFKDVIKDKKLKYGLQKALKEYGVNLQRIIKEYEE